MWIISKEFGAFNTDNLSAIRPPEMSGNRSLVVGYDSGHGHRITEGDDDYRKILAALVNDDNFVEVS